jgi:hypothetical protein
MLAVLLLLAADSSHAGTYEGVAKIEFSGGEIQQRVTSFTANPVLPRDFNRSGVLTPGTYAISFDISTAGDASDDPNDDQPISKRDFEYQTLTGSFSLDLVGGAFTVTNGQVSHSVEATTNSVLDPNGNLDEGADSADVQGFTAAVGGQAASALGQYGMARASLDSVMSGGFSGSAETLATASNSSGLASGATGGSNRTGARARSRWIFVVTEDVSYSLTSHFDGVGMPGASQDAAVPPNAYDADAQAASFFAAQSNDWFELVGAGRVLFETTDGSLFTGITSLPVGIDVDDVFSVEVGGVDQGTFSGGDGIEFGAGAASFVVSQIELSAGLPPPAAFPIQLAFDSDGASFDATLLPEPFAAAAGWAAIATLGWVRRMRS